MADKPNEEQSAKTPESPTTARELDFDDEANEPSSRPQSQVASATPGPKRVSFQDVSDEDDVRPTPPPKTNPRADAEATLMEAFPTVDPKIVRVVLTASGGQVEPAFNALLGMSDPDYVPEQAAPPQPPRPSQRQQPRNRLTQLERDEIYARQLADQFNTSAPVGYGNRGVGDPALPQRQQTHLKPNELYDDREHSFFDDDLPVIKQNIQQGFEATRTTVNKWISDLTKKFDGEEEERPPPLPGRSNQPQRQNYGPSQAEQLYGIRKNAERTRRSGEHTRYDADPTVLGDDFAQLELHDNDPSGDRRSGRPPANPDLFKPTPTGPTPQSGPVDEVDALYRQPTPTGQQTGANNGAKGSAKKWQPLTSVAPNPETENNDPFSLGDSDEETEKKTDLRPEDTERLKKVASDSGGSGAAATIGAPLEAAEKSGQKDKVAEDILTGKK